MQQKTVQATPDGIPYIMLLSGTGLTLWLDCPAVQEHSAEILFRVARLTENLGGLGALGLTFLLDIMYTLLHKNIMRKMGLLEISS